MKTIAVFCALLASGQAGVLQTVRLRSSDYGLLGAMRRVSCPPSWLAAVMANNGIAENRLTRLPRGLKIEMPSCAGAPSAKDQADSARILAKGAPLQKSMRWQKHRVDVLLTEMRHAQNQLEKERADFKTLQAKLSALEAQLSRRRLPPLKTLLAFFLLGAAISSLGWLLWHRRLQKRREMLAREVSHLHAGKFVRFKLVSEPRHYECPLCSAQDIERHHFERHLQRKHPSLRLEEIEVRA